MLRSVQGGTAMTRCILAALLLAVSAMPVAAQAPDTVLSTEQPATTQDPDGKNPPVAVAEELIKALKTDDYEIRVGQTEELYRLFLSSPSKALDALRSRAQTVSN